jgi:hypothetical protein
MRICVKLAAAVIAAALAAAVSCSSGTGGPDSGGSTGTEALIAQMVSDVSSNEISSFVSELVSLGPRYSTASSGNSAAIYIHDCFAARGASNVQYQTVVHNFVTYSPNVVATFTGSVNAGEIYVLCGHYDTENNTSGADDNGSGLAALMEAARILGSRNFEATIKIAAFTGEEKGLRGSAVFASDADANNWNLKGVINLDMIGYVAAGDTEDIDLIYHSSYNAGLVNASITAQTRYVPDFAIKTFNYATDARIPGNFSSDHESFWVHNFPAVFFHEDVEQINPIRFGMAPDTIGTGLNSYGMVVKITRTAIATVATLARPVAE